MQTITEIIKKREDQIRAQIANSGLAGKVFPEWSKIRIMQPLLQSNGQYVFNIKDQNVDQVTTFSLNRNDVFIPSLWGVRIVLKDSKTGALLAYTFAPKNDGTNPSAYPVGFKTDAIEALYDGNVQWLLDNNVALSAYPMEMFKRVPETQPFFVLDNEGGAVQESVQLQHNINNALELLYTKYQICGTRDHKITVFFDAANKNFDLNDTNYTAYIELIMLGHLVKGGCQTPSYGKSPFGDAVGQW